MTLKVTIICLCSYEAYIPEQIRAQLKQLSRVYLNPFYYIPITDTTLELSVFWPSDTESRINELRFSESISLSFKTRLTSVTCFFGDVP